MSSKKNAFKIVKIGKNIGLSNKNEKDLMNFVALNRDSSSASKKVASAIFRKLKKKDKKEGKVIKFIIERQTPLKNGTKTQRAYTAVFTTEKVTIKRGNVELEVNKAPKVAACLKTKVK